MSVQIVEIAGQKMAMLPVADYERLLDIVEDRADCLAADRAESRRAEGEEYVPAELVDRILNGESALKVWRTFRGLSQEFLAIKAKTSVATISRMEKGKLWNDPQRCRAVADILEVSVDDIMPY